MCRRISEPPRERRLHRAMPPRKAPHQISIAHPCHPPSTTGLKPELKHSSCQMALYHCFPLANHGYRRLAAAALDGDAAARVEPAARRDIGRIGHHIAKADIRHPETRLRR